MIDEQWDRMYRYLQLFVRTYRWQPKQGETWAGAGLGAWAVKQRASVEWRSRPRSNMSADRIRPARGRARLGVEHRRGVVVVVPR
ncbi:MAG: hypothetical protein ABR564_00850 [Candidatus Dormibacteria bacterium]